MVLNFGYLEHDMKHTAEITVYIHAQRDYKDEIKFSVLGCDMSQYGYTLLETKQTVIDFDIADDFSLEAEEIKAMRAEQKRIQAEAQLLVTRLEERIQSRLCIEHKAEA